MDFETIQFDFQYLLERTSYAEDDCVKVFHSMLYRYTSSEPRPMDFVTSISSIPSFDRNQTHIQLLYMEITLLMWVTGYAYSLWYHCAFMMVLRGNHYRLCRKLLWMLFFHISQLFHSQMFKNNLITMIAASLPLLTQQFYPLDVIPRFIITLSQKCDRI